MALNAFETQQESESLMNQFCLVLENSIKGWNGSTVQTMQIKLQRWTFARTRTKKKIPNRRKVETKETLSWQFYAYFVHQFLFLRLFVTLSSSIHICHFFCCYYCTIHPEKRKKQKGLWSDKNVNDLFCTVLWHSVAQVKCKLKQIEMMLFFKWKCILWAAMLRIQLHR